jgi:hypothetical protein
VLIAKAPRSSSPGLAASTRVIALRIRLGGSPTLLESRTAIESVEHEDGMMLT